ncbi:MAG TPA: methyltransferase domain-containing protein [Polyangiaceae bacterium]|nr:methyltransferase domain-containing protein [Polyangiaceae bacterium]
MKSIATGLMIAASVLPFAVGCGGERAAKGSAQSDTPAQTSQAAPAAAAQTTESASTDTDSSTSAAAAAAPAAGVAPATFSATAQSSTEGEATEAADPPTRRPDVVYVPTPQPVVDKMLELAKVKKTDVVYDLGCGDGRIVVTAAKRYGVKAFGFDIDPQRIAEARANVRDNKVEHLVTIQQKDIFTLDLSPASVVTLYLLPQLNVKLIPQLEKLKPGSRVVSHDFDMAGVTPVQHLTLKPEGVASQHEVYLWHAPIKRD